MSDSKFLYPKAGSIRQPTSNSRHHGRIVNPPRMNQLAGLDQLHEPHGHYASKDMTIRKPGGTK